RFIMPEILVIDGKMYHPTVVNADDPIASALGMKQMQLEEIVSEDEPQATPEKR
ncbi:unnamed protein product, partial [marine sediment metagenome]